MTTDSQVRMGTPAGRGVIFAAVLGSCMTFIDGVFVNVALPNIDEDLGLGVSGFQWIVSGYLLAVSSLLILGGNLGDRYGRRKIYLIGMGIFTAASVLCGLAVSTEMLILSRLIQGAGGALMVPASLAIVQAAFVPEDRGRAIGTWTGLGSLFIAAGPFIGGLFVTYGNWRWAFLINVPLAVLALWAAMRWVPESKSDAERSRPDIAGTVLITAGLGGILYWAIEGGNGGSLALPLAVAGIVSLVAFVFVERSVKSPLVAPSLFNNSQFSWINLCTLLFYGAFGAGLTFLAVRLQVSLGYDPLEAGMATIPVSVLMFFLAGRFGALGQRIGPKIPMTVGPAIVAVALAMMGTVDPGTSYWTGVLPAVVLWGFGLSITVAPLTAAALAVADQSHISVASAINNAASRVGQAFGVAAIPVVAGMAGGASLGGPKFDAGYQEALVISAVVSAVAALLALLFVKGADSKSAAGQRTVPAP